jgi:hypothetical protein
MLSALASRAAAQCASWDSNFSNTSHADGAVFSFIAFDNGTGSALYAGGSFTSIGGTTAYGIARWNGAQWSSIDTPLLPGYPGSISAQAVFDDGSGPALYAGGVYAHILAVYPVVARWNGGASWTYLPALMPSTSGHWVHALLAFDDGSGPALYVGGSFDHAGGVPALDIAKWDGTQWSALGSGIVGSVDGLAAFDDGSGPALYAGGEFSSAGGAPASNVAKWNGTSWSPLGSGLDGAVKTMTAFQDGSGSALFVGGQFTNAGGVTAPFAARWNGVSWSALGGAGNGMNNEVDASIVFDDGFGPKLYAGGAFTNAGGTVAAHIARWDGASWSRLDNSFSVNPTQALGVFNDGHDGDADLYVGGGASDPHIAEWHGCGVMAYCEGDGSAAPCPCGNSGSPGHGCDNSHATGGALLSASGTTSPDVLTLTQTSELPASLSIFLQGNASLGTPVAFGDGVRCVGGLLKRLYVEVASSGTTQAPGAGEPSITSRSAALGDPIAPGSTRYYQVYYRDPSATFCPSPMGDTFNVGNGLRVAW